MALSNEQQDLFRRLLRHGIDANGNLTPDSYVKLYNSGVIFSYFEDFDDKENDFVPSPYSVVFDFAKRYYDEYNKPPSDDILLDNIVQHKRLNTTEKSEYRSVILGICRMDAKPGDVGYLIDAVRREAVDRATNMVLTHSLEIRKTKGGDAQRKYISEQMAMLAVHSKSTKQQLSAYSAHELAQELRRQYHTDEEAAQIVGKYGMGEIDRRTQGLARGEMAVIAGPSHVGKDQPLWSRLATPTGWILMGNAKAGDTILGGDGSPVRITAVYPQGVRPVYKVTLNDGTSTHCGPDHLWLTYTYTERDRRKAVDKTVKGSVKTTMQIASSLKSSPSRTALNHLLPGGDVAYFEGQAVSIDPYLLGLTLGDGSYLGGSPSYTSADDELVQSVKRLLPDGLVLNPSASNKYTYYIKRLVRKKNNPHVLKALFVEEGLWGKASWDKHIPEKYKINSKEIRLAVIQGLMDTDGEVGVRGELSYGSTSKRLVEDFAFIARSLGYRVNAIRVKKTSYKKKVDGEEVRVLCKDFYSVRFKVPVNGDCPCRLRRKVERWMAYREAESVKQGAHRMIQSVEYIGEMETQCITVDDPRNLYMTDDFIVTHNTYVAYEIGLHNCVDLGKKVVFASNEMKFRPIANRFIARQTGIPINKLRDPRKHLDEFEQGLYFACLDEIEKNPDTYMFIEKGSFSNVTQLKAILHDRYGTDHGVDIVVLDYIDKMQPNERSGGADWEKMRRVSDEVYGWTAEENFALITPTQNNRQGMTNGGVKKGGEKAGIGELTWSQVFKDVDTLYMVTADPDDPPTPPKDPLSRGVHGTLNMDCLKHREAGDNWGVSLRANLAVASIKEGHGIPSAEHDRLARAKDLPELEEVEEREQ